MRRPLRLSPGVCFLAMLVVLVSGVSSLADEEQPLEWKGMGEGTWVVTRRTMTVEQAGAKPETTSFDTRKTLVRKAGEAWGLKVERRVKGEEEWTLEGVYGSNDVVPEQPPPEGFASEEGGERLPELRDPQVEEVDVGSEKLTVDGKEHTCRVVRVSQNGAVVTIWRNKSQEDLKFVSVGSDKRASFTRLVLALARKEKVGGREVLLRETRLTWRWVRRDGAVDTQINTASSSDAVPGFWVRDETTTEHVAGGGTSRTSDVRQVVAFEVKPAKK